MAIKSSNAWMAFGMAWFLFAQRVSYQYLNNEQKNSFLVFAKFTTPLTHLFFIQVNCGYPGLLENGRVLYIGTLAEYTYQPYMTTVGQNKQIRYECDLGKIFALIFATIQ